MKHWLYGIIIGVVITGCIFGGQYIEKNEPQIASHTLSYIQDMYVIDYIMIHQLKNPVYAYQLEVTTRVQRIDGTFGSHTFISQKIFDSPVISDEEQTIQIKLWYSKKEAIIQSYEIEITKYWIIKEGK